MQKKLNFYIINDNYIKYLSCFDDHVAYNKNETRPYVGVILQINDMLYFAPMFSPKPKHKDYKDNDTFFKMYDEKIGNEYLGLIRFTDMIPVSPNDIYPLNIKDEVYNHNYKLILNKQYNYINSTKNRMKINEKAESLYNIVAHNKGKVSFFYKKLSCNFKLLEEKCLEYQKISEQQSEEEEEEDR